MTRPTWGAVTRRWAFRLAFAASLVGIAVAYGSPLWYRLHGQRLVVITGDSMSPHMRAGDAAVLQPLSGSQLRVGQVVTLQPPGQRTYVTHRIVAIERKVVKADGDSGYLTDPVTGKPMTSWFVRTKGDGNQTPDENLTPIGSIRGQVVDRIEGFGKVLLWSRTPSGRLTLFAPPLLLLLGAELLAWRRDRRARRPSSMREAEVHASAVPA